MQEVWKQAHEKTLEYSKKCYSVDYNNPEVVATYVLTEGMNE